MYNLPPETEKSLEEQLCEVFDYHSTGAYAQAESSYLRLLARFPDIWQLYFNYGLLLYDLNRLEDALDIYGKGIAINDTSADLFYNTAICQKELGLLDEAVESYKKALAMTPGDIDCLYNLAGCYRVTDEEAKAASLYTTILQDDPDHLPSLSNLAYLCHKGGENKRAEALYRRILTLNPEHVFADHMLAAITGEQRKQASESYVREVFDQFSDHYEASLTDKLSYDLPTKLLAFTRRYTAKEGFSAMLDLGCGTGLVGETFKTICRSMTGVDISAKMISIAAGKQLYDSLYVSEILKFLQRSEAVTYDLMISGDVFPYFGDLQPLFECSGRLIGSGGAFIFSVEDFAAEASQPRLQQSGRFAHSSAYILETAAATGWRITACEVTDLRLEKGTWIRGCIYAMTRA